MPLQTAAFTLILKDLMFLLSPYLRLMIESYCPWAFIAVALGISIPLSHAISPSKRSRGRLELEPEFRELEVKEYKPGEYSKSAFVEEFHFATGY